MLFFERPSGERKLVAWTAPPAKQSPDKARTHTLDIPIDTPGPLELCDLYGKKKPLRVGNGKITVTLTGSPQYVHLPAANTAGRKE